jgi:hypothetical protein
VTVTLSSVRIPHATLIVGIAAALIAAALLWLSRTYNFYFDEWTFILTAPDWTWVTYLQPHNEHPSILFRLLYDALLNTVGMRSYLPYMAVLLALHAVNVVLLFLVVRGRGAGDAVALGSAAVLLVLGAGWENILWAFQMAWLASVACGLAMLLALQARPSRSTVVLAVALATASLMFSGIGLTFAAFAVVMLATTPPRRREVLWFVPLGVAVVAWYLAFGRAGTPPNPPPTASNIVLVPLYAAWGLGQSAAGLIGESGAWGPPALVAAALAIGLTWRRRRPDPFALGAVAALVTLYVVTGLTRAQLGYTQSGSGRYVYEGAAFLLLLLADAARNLPWRGTWRLALVACLFLACFNSGVLLFTYAVAKGAQMQRETADLQALAAERSDPCLSADGSADPLVMPQVDNPALYYRAVDRYGDPVAGLPVTDRADFDRAQANLTRLGQAPGRPGCG